MKDKKKPAWQKALEDQAKSKVNFQGTKGEVVPHFADEPASVAAAKAAAAASYSLPGSPMHDPATCPLCSPVAPAQTVTHFSQGGFTFTHTKGEKCNTCDGHPFVPNDQLFSQDAVNDVYKSIKEFQDAYKESAKALAAQQEAISAQLGKSMQSLMITMPAEWVNQGYADSGMIQSFSITATGSAGIVKAEPSPGYYGDSMRLLRAAIPALAEYTLREHAGDEYDYGVEMYRRYTHRANCPHPGCPLADQPLAHVIMHLNDEHGWPRVAGEDSWLLRRERTKLADLEAYIQKTNVIQGGAITLMPHELAQWRQSAEFKRKELEQLSARLAGHNIADWLDEYSAATGADLSFRSPDEETEEKDHGSED